MIETPELILYSGLKPAAQWKYTCLSSLVGWGTLCIEKWNFYV